ncbi:acyl carrier protein [Actinomadura decatromicini]|uniref:Acyl carrier protein n=1 Tax=Actinomadura decatromicini TaxID=2604572 RepID=A0A5D3FDR1_9ACTN|nr:acyl carrier protein [Actinomadura decatromicini]TYK46182.1 acyl carrier protein [Actinomadura decatromicini]
MNPPAHDVLAEVVRALTDVVGEDLPCAEIGHGTALGGDLALESIEFVALVDRLRARYGDRADLPGFVAGLELDEIMNLTVGDVVDHIVGRPSEAPAGGGTAR